MQAEVAAKDKLHGADEADLAVAAVAVGRGASCRTCTTKATPVRQPPTSSCFGATRALRINEPPGAGAS